MEKAAALINSDEVNVNPLVARVEVEFAKSFKHFKFRNADYPDMGGISASDILGVRGQYGDILRKALKLKKPMWDGEELVGEGTIEVLRDLMSHCALAIDLIERGHG